MSQQIQIAFDPGSSATKAIYKLGGQTPHVILMEPEVIEVPLASIEQRSGYGDAGIVTPVNDAWISFRQRDENCFAVGYLARQLRASINLNRLKYENALFKLLAVLGAVVQREQLDGSDISVWISVLLPLGEFADRERFEQQLKQQIRSFYFRGERIQADLQEVRINPEGGGFTLELLRDRGKEWFTSREAICSLMLGHRNSSALVFSRGQLNMSASGTTDLGFVQLVDKVIQKTSGQNRYSLTRTLYEIGNDISSNNLLLRSLAKSERSKNVEQEIDQIVEAISVARQEYWQILKSWIDSVLPNRVDKLCVCGGAGYYLRNEIQNHLGWADPLWGESSGIVWEAAERLEDPSLNRRLLDVWYIFQWYFITNYQKDRQAA